MKKCTKCKIDKKLEEFSFRKKANKYQAECKKCEYERNKKYKLKNKSVIDLKNKKYREDEKEIIKEAFESKKKRDEILEKNQLAYTMGITGVPLVMFNDQVAVQGAENKDSIIEKIKRFN